ncbi:MAG: hypothetical protein RL104_815, partial [Bacteroidota bacterium]
MKTRLLFLALGVSLSTLAQEAPKVRVEKRVVVIKDGTVLASPPDSLLQG